MADNDALSTFDFSSFGDTGLFVKFEVGKPLTLRILTVDPVVSQQEFEDKETGEVNLSAKFSFIVYNFTDEKAQIWSATPPSARKIGALHVDPEFGADIKKVDIRVTATGEKKNRRYDIQVLPKARQFTNTQIQEAQAINLDEKVEGQRMSLYKPEETSGYEKAKAVASSLKQPEDVIIEDLGGEPINIDDIPF